MLFLDSHLNEDIRKTSNASQNLYMYVIKSDTRPKGSQSGYFGLCAEVYEGIYGSTCILSSLTGLHVT